MLALAVISNASADDVTQGYQTIAVQTTLEPGSLKTWTGNASAPEGCVTVSLNEMAFLPWNNPDNIVSAEVEATARRIKDAILLPLLFLISGPANVINMAVFFRQGLHERVNLCLFALSLADELYLVQTMFLYGEQLHLQFSTKEVYGPMMTFMVNNNLVGFFGFSFVSQILSAIIASERCLCVVSPLKAQMLFRTKTMAVIIVILYITVVGLYFFVATRYRIGCVFDQFSGVSFKTAIAGEFFITHEKLITYLDSFVYGAGIPGVVVVVVTTTTILTTVRLRQIVSWRAEASTAISIQEIALTKMLIGSSVLFIICVTPIGVFRFVNIFIPEMNNGRRNQNLYLTSLWILEIVSYINSTFNMFVYYAMGSRYRQTFWTLFSRRKTDEKKHISK
ncbi:hypothetical protein ACOMHN_042115 [Nucella lapillus]